MCQYITLLMHELTILIDAVQDINSPQNQDAFMYEMSTCVCVCVCV